MWHVHRTCSRHALHHTPHQASVTAEVSTHAWAPAKESVLGRQCCLEFKSTRFPYACWASMFSSIKGAHNARFQAALWEISNIWYGKHLAPWGTRWKLGAWELVLSFEFLLILLHWRACGWSKWKNWSWWTSWSSTLAFIAKSGQMAALTDGICF